MADEELKFEVDEFIKNVIPDPAQPQGTLFVRAYLGESNKEGCVRLYHDPGLNYYADIKKEDIVYLLKIPKTFDPLGGVMVWLKQPVAEPVNTNTEQANNDASIGQQYFQGNIYQQYLGLQQAQQPIGGYVSPCGKA